MGVSGGGERGGMRGTRGVSGVGGRGRRGVSGGEWGVAFLGGRWCPYVGVSGV